MRDDSSMHSRRARPTLRLLSEDLTADWTSPSPRRLLNEGRLDELHPFSELAHPIIRKAAEAFGPDAGRDNYVGPIACSTRLPLLEIKAGQWRGGVWRDPNTDVRWLVVAGLAKGDHQDHDDFYHRVERHDAHGDSATSDRWLPSVEDNRLLKRETVARLLTTWELQIQRHVYDALNQIICGGTAEIPIDHPLPGNNPVATLILTIAIVREDGYEADEVELEVIAASQWEGSNLLWQLTLRALISLCPPEQGWDRFKTLFSNIAEPGYFSARSATLSDLVSKGVLDTSVPGQHAHYAHREHLAGKTIDGKAVRALCGVHFVPTQDHEALPRCPSCDARLAELPS